MDDKRVIRMYSHEPLCFSGEEFATLERELVSRRIAGEWTVIERLAHALWKDNRGRYLEISRPGDGAA